MIPILKTFLSILFLSLLSGCSLYDCSNDIYLRLDNNAAQYKVVKFSRDCGATTGFSTQISVLPIAEKLSDDQGGNIFVCDGNINSTNLTVQWIDDMSVLITYPKHVKIFKSDSTIAGLQIRYKTE